MSATFKSGKLINIQTIETIHKKELDFRVDHRFGDIAGKGGGASQFFGLDHASDIRIGFDYGISDNLNIGIARAKGASELTQLFETIVKYKFLEQTNDTCKCSFFWKCDHFRYRQIRSPNCCEQFHQILR